MEHQLAMSGLTPGALRSLVTIAEEPTLADDILDDLDPASREIVNRLQSLAAFAETKHQEANAIARDFDQVGADIKLVINQVLDNSRAAGMLATQIARGELAIRPPMQLPDSFGAALAPAPAAALLRVPVSALIEYKPSLVGLPTPNQERKAA